MGVPLRPPVLDTTRRKDAALKEVAARIKRLSFTDMTRLSDMMGKRPDTESMALSLIAVADEILGPIDIDHLDDLTSSGHIR